MGNKTATPRANPVPAWVYWAIVIGLSFIAGFSFAAFLFTNLGGEAAAGAPATAQQPAPVAAGNTPAAGETPKATRTADPEARLYTYEEALGLLYESMPITAPTGAAFTRLHETDEGDPAIGAETAAVTITEYSDFSCGYCRRFYNETLRQLLDAYGDDVRFVYRDFPVLGEGSQKAAIAAECAGAQERFWDYHNYLFANPGTFHDLGLSAIAYRMGLDLEAFQACLTSPEIMAEVQEDFDAARALGLTGTPSFAINGELVVGAQPLEKFKEIIDAKRASAGD